MKTGIELIAQERMENKPTEGKYWIYNGQRVRIGWWDEVTWYDEVTHDRLINYKPTHYMKYSQPSPPNQH